MTRNAALLLLPALLIFAFLPACETIVDPTLDNPRPFTVWGVLNAGTDTHAVRVFEIADTLAVLRPGTINAEVHSTDLETGERHTWQDSLLTLADGTGRHVFWAVFPTRVNHRYRVAVRRPDGDSSYAEATIPAPVALEKEPPVATITRATQTVKVIGSPPSIPHIELAYDLGLYRGDGIYIGRMWIGLPYRDKLDRGRDNWEVEIDYMRDFRDLLFGLDDMDVNASFLVCHEVELRVHVGDENWVSPVGVFDPEFLVEPGVFSNVKNGFGFVGAGYVERERWIPDRAVLSSAGFGLNFGE